MTNNALLGPLGINETPLDYLISSTVTSSIIAGGINFSKVKKGEIDKNEAIKNTLKVSSQAGIATGSAIATIGYFLKKNYLGAAISLAVGTGSVMAIEKMSQNMEEKTQ